MVNPHIMHCYVQSLGVNSLVMSNSSGVGHLLIQTLVKETEQHPKPPTKPPTQGAAHIPL